MKFLFLFFQFSPRLLEFFLKQMNAVVTLMNSVSFWQLLS